MPGIIDFHTHAFPDAVAVQAVPALAAKGKVTPCLDGRIESLLTSMNLAGVDKSVLCSIATRPGQFDSILAWSKSIRSERIIPFPSFHPENPKALENIRIIREEGFKGIKMHPYYQNFTIDEERMLPFYEAISAAGLILVMHTGFDIGFPREDIAGPARVRTVIDRFPSLKFIATHLGAWEMWDEVCDLLIGRKVYLDISFSLQYLDRDKVRQMMLDHPADRILFGTDSPWADQAEVATMLKSLELGEELEEKIFRTNGLALLGMD
ncbi:MAG: amidohydrolase family protein [Proteobacteria bacterium]|nr:amidohydrolase family protein [Pseudomonadota bacterium]MBU1687831.1 amidohydrolase family protein [Pseudomonadota bacterium]